MTPSPAWAHFQGVLTSCLEKLLELYRQAMREDRGDYDWSVRVQSAALGQVNEEIFPQALLERVRQGIHRQDEALLEYDLSWLGQALEGLWVFARLYLAGSTVPAALVHRIDFAEEDAESPLNADFEEVNDERSLDKEGKEFPNAVTECIYAHTTPPLSHGELAMLLVDDDCCLIRVAQRDDSIEPIVSTNRFTTIASGLPTSWTWFHDGARFTHDDRCCAFMTLPRYTYSREDDCDARAAQVT